MGCQQKKSKRQSDGKDTSPPSAVVLYLDENLCDCRPIQLVLEKHGIRYQRHLAVYARGTEDHVWLPFVGDQGWVVLGKDKNLRYNMIERDALLENKVRSFEFAKGNLSKDEMADALDLAIPQILAMLAREEAPFVASITKNGTVHLKWNAKGSVANRKGAKRKTKRLAQTIGRDDAPTSVASVDIRRALAEWVGEDSMMADLFCPHPHESGLPTVMMPQDNGSRLCGRCQHSYVPGNPKFECGCVHCKSGGTLHLTSQT